ncbi:MAG: 4-hydroxy-tetrahydrodipicolinate reductase [Clostridia bacterium]|nr:4-hydroxy-tetrahydrodipicolinate reductase [Clostridia bacterium]
MNRILLCGALGRMGREIAHAAKEYGFEIAAGVDYSAAENTGFPLYTGFSDAIQEEADVIVDFSRAAALPGLLEYAVAHKLPCVLASTGYGEKENQLISEAAKAVPVFVSANMSVGVYVLKKLIRAAKEMLPQADIEIIEKHHRQKEDSPSGTAAALLQALTDEDTRVVYGRHGLDTKRRSGEIGVHAVRGGTLCGEHEVDFLMDNEVISISHSAQNRGIFANGALRAANFLLGKPAGLYGMDDLMGKQA